MQRAACFPPGFSPGFFQDFLVLSVYLVFISVVPLFPCSRPHFFSHSFLLSLFSCGRSRPHFFSLCPSGGFYRSFLSHPSDSRFPRHSFFLFLVWLSTLFSSPSPTAFCCAYFSFSGFEKVGVDEQGVVSRRLV